MFRRCSYCLLCAVFSSVFVILGPVARADDEIGDDGYNHKYDNENKSFKQRMKDARSIPDASPKNIHGGPALGLDLSLGQTYSSEPGSSAGFGYTLGVEPTYILQTDSWNRWEFKLALGVGSWAWSEKEQGQSVDMTIPMAPYFMAKVGWGASIGSNMMGVLNFGFGGVNGYNEAKASGSSKSKSETKMGTAIMVGYDFVSGADDSLQFFGGLGVTHLKFNFGEYTQDGVKTSVDKVTDLNYGHIHGGLRFKF